MLASIDRLELALGRIAAAAEALGMKLVRSVKSASFHCDGETIGFSIREGVRREKHVPPEKELAEQEVARKRSARRWSNRNRWDDDIDWSFLRGPEWDYHPIGLLAFELEQSYLIGGSPRRSFKDAKVQRIENMATDIAVGIAVLAAAKQDDRLKREEQVRQRDQKDRKRRRLLSASGSATGTPVPGWPPPNSASAFVWAIHSEYTALTSTACASSSPFSASSRWSCPASMRGRSPRMGVSIRTYRLSGPRPTRTGMPPMMMAPAIVILQSIWHRNRVIITVPQSRRLSCPGATWSAGSPSRSSSRPRLRCCIRAHPLLRSTLR